MIRVIKDVIKMLFLLAGILFTKVGFAQVSLQMKGGGADGAFAGSFSSCIPATIVASGGSFDGAGLLAPVSCTNFPSTLVTSGGFQNGAFSGALGNCSPVAVVA